MKTTFLLVDDDLDNSELFCETLKEVDHSVICHITISGEDALHLLEDIRKPTLIFADVHMPGMNGWEFLQRLKSHEVYKHIPVIMHSSVANQKEIDMAYESGAYAFLIKPRHHKELKRILRSLINKIKAGPLEPLALQGISLNKGYDLKEL